MEKYHRDNMKQNGEDCRELGRKERSGKENVFSVKNL
jgi:hypothetical protein